MPEPTISLTRADAALVFGLAVLTEDRQADEQAALDRLAEALDAGWAVAHEHVRPTTTPRHELLIREVARRGGWTVRKVLPAPPEVPDA